MRLFIVQERISRGFSEPGKTGKRASVALEQSADVMCEERNKNK